MKTFLGYIAVWFTTIMFLFWMFTTLGHDIYWNRAALISFIIAIFLSFVCWIFDPKRD